MATKRRIVPRRAKKGAKKPKPARLLKTSKVRKKNETKKPLEVLRQVGQQSTSVEPPARERVVITVENIQGDTAIGDLLVTFPRTREVLVRKGLRLEAEDAGDIHMTLDVFSAMNGIRTETLVEELVEIAKEPLPQPVAPIVAAPTI